MNPYDVIVVGGGASGMMAAGRAAERGKRVLLLEQNERLGKKLATTGGGRCNITNAEEDPHRLLAHYGRAAKFLFSPFSRFGVPDTFSFFAARGLPLVVEAGQRAFPKTQKAADVVRVLEQYLREGRVAIRTRAKVGGLVAEPGRIRGARVDGETLSAGAYVLATGGKAHPETGSTGDGFRWLSKLGHTVQEPTPTIVPLAVREPWVKQLAGVALDPVKVTFFLDGKKKLALRGRVLCTHFGLSGPLILNAAGRVADLLHEGEVTATIDLLPELDHGAADRHVTGIFDANKNKSLRNVFKTIVPAGTARVILSLVPHVDPETKVNRVTRERRKEIVDLLKALPVSISGLMGYDRAVVADGGISIEEVDGKTMRSRSYENLYVTGDVLHITRPSGGYSLQLCWTSGYVAGSHV